MEDLINMKGELLQNNISYFTHSPIIVHVTIFDYLLITISLFILSKFFWMIIYEYRYYKGAGEDYLKYGKNFVQGKNLREVLKSINQENEKN